MPTVVEIIGKPPSDQRSSTLVSPLALLQICETTSLISFSSWDIFGSLYDKATLQGECLPTSQVTRSSVQIKYHVPFGMSPACLRNL